MSLHLQHNQTDSFILKEGRFSHIKMLQRRVTPPAYNSIKQRNKVPSQFTITTLTKINKVTNNVFS
jgi:hypothetical protein